MLLHKELPASHASMEQVCGPFGPYAELNAGIAFAVRVGYRAVVSFFSAKVTSAAHLGLTARH